MKSRINKIETIASSHLSVNKILHTPMPISCNQEIGHSKETGLNDFKIHAI